MLIIFIDYKYIDVIGVYLYIQISKIKYNLICYCIYIYSIIIIMYTNRISILDLISLKIDAAFH